MLLCLSASLGECRVLSGDPFDLLVRLMEIMASGNSLSGWFAGALLPFPMEVVELLAKGPKSGAVRSWLSGSSAAMWGNWLGEKVVDDCTELPQGLFRSGMNVDPDKTARLLLLGQR